MPCTLTGSVDGDRALYSKERVTDLTQKLCALLTFLENGYPIVFMDKNLPKGIKVWWREHKKLDARRRKSK